ncbi:hypothetical protein DESAMIL20_116 [Desulfurella amilsii]|uniref:Putative regulatory protein FmdB zinc ribbon domain-containing protein n=1 Tax=Desulfurella amilsii TaxID=1562698 RepID=A0A1X4XZQ5_9BACT|nr:zinc ribbon domain-containing protein [Desulfurella amilsii]OSS43008.1 hypothetical protein DESAMIL20_116 [Desulfurella amilsii]
MPIYEYKCSDCGKTIEFMQKMGAKAPSACPSCGAINSLKKLISHTSFELKGSGWYVTDYKNNSKPTNSKVETNKGESTNSKVEANKGESKNAGKDVVNH